MILTSFRTLSRSRRAVRKDGPLELVDGCRDDARAVACVQFGLTFNQDKFLMLRQHCSRVVSGWWSKSSGVALEEFSALLDRGGRELRTVASVKN